MQCVREVMELLAYCETAPDVFAVIGSLVRLMLAVLAQPGDQRIAKHGIYPQSESQAAGPSRCL